MTALLQDMYPDTLTEQPEQSGFRIDDDRAAEWALRKIKEIRAERDRLQAGCQEQIDYYTARADALQKKAEADEGYFAALLSDYFDQQPHSKTKTQETYALPGGKLVLKHPAAKVDKDDAALLAWCKANAPDKVQVKEAPMWAELKKECKAVDGGYVHTATGELLPGVKLTEQPDKFVVEVAD